MDLRALLELRRVNEVGSTEFLGPRLLVRVRVDRDDATGADEGRSGKDTELLAFS